MSNDNKLPPFDDERVQTVYAVLCEDTPPPNLNEHWEGYLARRIVAALAATSEKAGPMTIASLSKASGRKASAIFPAFANTLPGVTLNQSLSEDVLGAALAEKPAAAAERAPLIERISQMLQGPNPRGSVFGPIMAGRIAERVADLLLATPPAQAAEPAQVDEVAHPIQPLVVAKDGCTRFKKNPIVNYLYEWALPRGMGMNELHCLSEIAGFTDQDWQQFAQLIGYSLSGYGELSYVDDAAWDRANALTQRPAAPVNTEAAIAWAVLNHKGELFCVEQAEVTAWGVTLGEDGWTVRPLVYGDTRPAAPLATDAGVATADEIMSAVRALPQIKGPEFDGEEADGTPRYWRSRPHVSLTHLERLLRSALAAHPAAERPAQGEAGEVELLHYDEQQIADACVTAEISDSKCQSLLIALQETAPRAPEGGRNDTGGPET